MRHTKIIQSPVLTFFGPSELSIHRSVTILKNVLGLQEIKLFNKETTTKSTNNDALSQKLPYNSSTVLLQCPETNAKFQFLSVPSSSNDNTADKDFMLFTCMTNQTNDTEIDDIQHARDYLASNISSTTSSSISSRAFSFWNKLTGRNPMIQTLCQDENLPFVESPTTTNSDDEKNSYTTNHNDESKAYLREIVIPYFEDEGESTQSLLSTLPKPINPLTKRPMAGLYKWPMTNKNSKQIYIRPIPAGPEDQYLAPPSLIFQIPSSSFDLIADQNDAGMQFRKIGFNGNSTTKGQYIISNQSLNGIDIRLCPNTQLSPSFNEGEDTLFAGSIDELQRSNNSNDNIITSKPEVEDGDCWMEVRAMVKQYPNRLWEKYVAGNTNVWKRRRRKGKNVSMLLNKAVDKNCDGGSKSACNTKCNGRIVKAPKIVFE